MTLTAVTAAYVDGGGDSSPKQQRPGPQQQHRAPPFAFKVPQSPASSSSPLNSALKQRRVSLALPQAPRVVDGWDFRDDTGLDATPSNTRKGRSAAASVAASSTTKTSSPLSGAATTASNGDGNDDGPAASPKAEKKARKKWSAEETQMLVDGCNKHGVGNWKTILRDPTLEFDNRSPVDLKDRFRTYFPDAYKLHYPNAKTHLSSKVRSTLPDGSSLFEKTRSKRRRPFTEEEDKALKDGYEKYGTVWATIVKEYPIFQEQNRRSTDLRDRFRNAFPELYQLAGYKPRNAKKPRVGSPERKSAVDDQQLSTGGPVRSRRRAHTHQGMLRGGTKSVPQSTACSEDDESDEESESFFSPFKAPPTPPSAKNKVELPSPPLPPPPPPPPPPPTFSPLVVDNEDEEMDLIPLDPLSEALSLPDIVNSQPTDMDQDGQWSSGINTPTHSNHWSTAAGSPTSSHLSSDLLMNDATSSPFLQRHSNPNNHFGMIGKSAWGTDWFSPNPRLDPSSSAIPTHSNTNNGPTSSSSPSYFEQSSPASPFSLNHLSHGVLDRYDLFPTTIPTDFSSEVGVGETHSAFSDDGGESLLFQGNGRPGFMHHSSYAGDLIFGARTYGQGGHHGLGGYYGSLSSAAVNALGGGGGAFGAFGSLGLNLGAGAFQLGQQQGQGQQQQGQQQQGQQQQNAGIHPMQLHSRSSGMLDGIVEGAGIQQQQQGEADPLGIPLPPDAMDEDLDLEDSVEQQQQQQLSTQHQHAKLSQQQQQSQHQHHLQQAPDAQSDDTQTLPSLSSSTLTATSGMLNVNVADPSTGMLSVVDPSTGMLNVNVADPSTQFSLDDFVDLSNELHYTPPATPITQPRPVRRSSGSMVHPHFAGFAGFGGVDPGVDGVGCSGSGSGGNGGPGGGGLHARSISVPPSEFRNSLYVPGMSALDGGYASALIDFDAVTLGGLHHLHGVSLNPVHGAGQQRNLDQQNQHQHQQGMSGFLGLRPLGMFQSLVDGQQGQRQGLAQRAQSQSCQPQNRTTREQASEDNDGIGIGRGRTERGASDVSVRVQAGLENNDDGEDDEEEEGEGQARPRTPTLASRHLLGVPPAIPVANSHSNSSVSSSSSSSVASAHSRGSSAGSGASGAGSAGGGGGGSGEGIQQSGQWRLSFLSNTGSGSAGAGGMSSNASLAADIYNLPFLDLHYYGSSPGGGGMVVQQPGGMMSSSSLGGLGAGGAGEGPGPGGDDLGFMDTPAQALDLAQSASSMSQSATFGSLFSPYGTFKQLGRLGAASGSLGGALGVGGSRASGQQQPQQHAVASSSLIQAFGTVVNGRGGGHLAARSRPPGTTPSTPASSAVSGTKMAHGASSSMSGINTSSSAIGTSSSINTSNSIRPSSLSLSGATGGSGESPFKQAALGRSQSHHRGQSHSATVNPRELGMRGVGEEGVRRKRASWDGRPV